MLANTTKVVIPPLIYIKKILLRKLTDLVCGCRLSGGRLGAAVIRIGHPLPLPLGRTQRLPVLPLPLDTPESLPLDDDDTGE